MILIIVDRHRDRPRRCRGFIGVVVLAVAVALGLSAAGGGRVGPTDAAWQTEQPATGTFAAATIPAPHLTQGCRYRSDWLGANARVEIYWAAPAGYDLNDAELSASTSGLGSALAPLTGFNLRSQTSSSAGNYTTTVPTHVLGGLLSLGAELEVSIRMTRYGWRSDSASIATDAGLIAGLGGSCRNLS